MSAQRPLREAPQHLTAFTVGGLLCPHPRIVPRCPLAPGNTPPYPHSRPHPQVATSTSTALPFGIHPPQHTPTPNHAQLW